MDQITDLERDEFKQWLKNKGLADSSISKYLYYFKLFGGATNMKQGYVDKFVASYAHQIPRAFVKSYREFIIRNIEGYGETINLNDVRLVEVPKKTGAKARKLPRILSQEHIIRLEQSISEEKYKLMLLISFYSGVRVSELVSLKPLDFNWDKYDDENDQDNFCEMYVHGKRSKDRVVFLPKQLLKRLDHYIKTEFIPAGKSENDSIWGIGTERWRQKLKEFGAAVGISNLTPHQLRHSFATHMLDNDTEMIAIRDLLGHSSVATTEIYAHVSPKKLKSAYGKVFS